MPVVKKLVFSLPFLVSLAYFFYLTNSILNPTEMLFSLSLQALYQTSLIAGVLLLAGFFFVLFATFSQEWKYVGPIALIATGLPFLLLPQQVTPILAGGTLITLLFVFALLQNKLKTYLTFQPIILLNSSMKSVATFLLIFVSIACFLTMQASVKANGIQVPDSLIETVAQMTSSSMDPTDLQSPLLSPEACKLLKTDPQQLLKNGVPQDQIDLIDPATCKLSQAKMHERLKAQAQDIFKPFTQYVPYLLALTLFLTMTSLAALLGLLLPFLIWVTFSILKSSGFTKYATEMREVKKLIV